MKLSNASIIQTPREDFCLTAGPGFLVAGEVRPPAFAWRFNRIWECLGAPVRFCALGAGLGLGFGVGLAEVFALGRGVGIGVGRGSGRAVG